MNVVFTDCNGGVISYTVYQIDDNTDTKRLMDALREHPDLPKYALSEKADEILQLTLRRYAISFNTLDVPLDKWGALGISFIQLPKCEGGE